MPRPRLPEVRVVLNHTIRPSVVEAIDLVVPRGERSRFIEQACLARLQLKQFRKRLEAAQQQEPEDGRERAA